MLATVTLSKIPMGGKRYVESSCGSMLELIRLRWWCVFLGVRRGNVKLSTPLGRETFIAPVKWHKDQQPQIEVPCMDFEIEDTQASSVLPIKSIIADERSQWIYVRTPSLADYTFVNDRSLRFKPGRARLSCETESPTFIGKRQRLMETISTVRLSSTECKSEAGLAVYKDPQQFATISFDSNDGTIHFEVQTPSRKAKSIAQWPWEDAKDVMFKIQATKEAYLFSYGFQLEGSEQRWTEAGQVTSTDLTNNDFTGTIFGIYAFSSNKSGEVQFSDINL